MPTLVKRVVAAMEKLAPLSLAERQWDNVGLLVEAPIPRSTASKVFLTIDLTLKTLSEAIRDPDVGVIIAYHPPIFKSFKRLTLEDTKQSIILHAVANGLSIYSPHTALDSCLKGVNDWIISGLGLIKISQPITLKVDAPQGQEGAGTGRICELLEPVDIFTLVQRVKEHFKLKHVRLARVERLSTEAESATISTIAVCAGSGASVLSGVKADVYLTGEMSHHEILAALADGSSVILCEHSNTERGYLSSVLHPALTSKLMPSDPSQPPIEVIVSQQDEDPIEIL